MVEYPLHRTEDLIRVFLDPEEEKELLGTVELVQFRGIGLPFVLEDNALSKDLNKVYVLEKWLGKIISSFNVNYPINSTTIVYKRVLYHVGQKTVYSTEPSELKDPGLIPLIDSFKLLPDQDISFWNARVDGSELVSEAY